MAVLPRLELSFRVKRPAAASRPRSCPLVNLQGQPISVRSRSDRTTSAGLRNWDSPGTVISIFCRAHVVSGSVTHGPSHLRIMNRDDALRTVRDRKEPWDIVIIGGGATGLGAGVEAAARGYATLVLEQHDFAKGTS